MVAAAASAAWRSCLPGSSSRVVSGQAVAHSPTGLLAAPRGVPLSRAPRQLRIKSSRSTGKVRALPDEEASSEGVSVQVSEKAVEEATEVASELEDATKQETLGEVLRKRRVQDPTKEKPENFNLPELNPYVIGRNTRAVFDDAWSKISKLGSSQSFMSSADFLDDGNELEAPQAAYTTVMVVGASGRVGRVVVRKLLLRGYTVKVLSRNPALTNYPESVEVIEGDVGDFDSVRQAVKGVDKVIYCAAARSTFTPDLTRVEYAGVSNFVKALQDQYNTRAIAGGKSKSSRAKVTLAEFKKQEDCDKWGLEHVGFVGDSMARKVLDRGQDYGAVNPTEARNLGFQGAVYSRSGYAEMGGEVDGSVLRNTEGLLIRMLGDGNTYTCTVTDSSGAKFSSRVSTKLGYDTIRLPFNTFRPLDFDGALEVEPKEVTHISFKFEPKRAGGGSGAFKIELDWIKALPCGEETDFMLISRAGMEDTMAPEESDEDVAANRKVIQFKRQGETALRNSGLGYTIIRPGNLIEEPGGYKALAFDQGNRLSDTIISCADVADVCVKALHEPLARNKTFEVCHEFTSADALKQYDLIANISSMSRNYLSSALVDLKSMT